VYFGTAGAAVHVVDDWKTHAQYPGKGAYRESTLQDLYDAARLVDHLEHIHFFQRCMVARDIEDPRAMDLNTTYASVAGTRKHCGVSYVDAAHAEEGLKLLHRIAGGESKWRARPFAITPGHPAIFGPWPFVSDLRTGAMSGGSGEQAVLMAACGQMGRHYDLPTGIAAGMADSKIPDAQSGGEKGYTLGLAGHSGANMVYEAAGMQGSLLGFSFEGALIDNDVLGAVNRSVRGIETDADSLAVRTITEVCIGGPEHFLGHDATLSRMQRDYVYPEVGNRLTPAEWQELGGHPVNIPAREKTREILSAHFPAHINDATDAKLREEFDIRLPRGMMKAGGV